MSGSELPEIMPRSIVVIELRKYQQMSADPKEVLLLQSTDAMVIPYSGTIKYNVEQIEPIRQLLKTSEQLAPDVVLVKDPFAKLGYVSAVSAQDALAALASTKYHLLANVIRLLGAREFKFVEVRAEQDSKAVSAKAGGNSPIKPVTVDVTASTSIKNRLSAKLTGEMVFDGGEPDTKTALEYLHQHQLGGDQQMRTLVDMRTAPNLIQQYRLTFNCTRESVLNVKAAASVAKVIGVEAHFEMDATALSEIEIVTEIQF